MFAPGTYAVTVDGNGSEKCVIVLADNGGPSVEITESSCFATLDGASLTVGSTILGDNITVTVTRDGTMLGTESFEPEYVTNEPNGAICGPSCENAGVAISIP